MICVFEDHVAYPKVLRLNLSTQQHKFLSPVCLKKESIKLYNFRAVKVDLKLNSKYIKINKILEVLGNKNAHLSIEQYE